MHQTCTHHYPSFADNKKQPTEQTLVFRPVNLLERLVSNAPPPTAPWTRRHRGPRPASPHVGLVRHAGSQPRAQARPVESAFYKVPIDFKRFSTSKSTTTYQTSVTLIWLIKLIKKLLFIGGGKRKPTWRACSLKPSEGFWEILSISNKFNAG